MEPDLDRIIDQAAEQIVGREPSDALTDAVMTEIIDGRWSMVNGRLAWAAAGVVACGLIALLVLSGIPPQIAEAPTQPPPAPAVAAPTMAGPAAAASTASSAEPVVRAVPQTVLPGIPPEEDVLAGVEPLAVDSISSDPIDVPPVQVVAVDPMAQIQIEPLIIEPLPTANN